MDLLVSGNGQCSGFGKKCYQSVLKIIQIKSDSNYRKKYKRLCDISGVYCDKVEARELLRIRT